MSGTGKERQQRFYSKFRRIPLLERELAALRDEVRAALAARDTPECVVVAVVNASQPPARAAVDLPPSTARAYALRRALFKYKRERLAWLEAETARLAGVLLNLQSELSRGDLGELAMELGDLLF